LKAEAEVFLKGGCFGSRLRAVTFPMAVIFGERERERERLRERETERE
jgi:hypothetical protein